MKRIKSKRPEGTALLVVLLVVMAVTILSLGFLSQSDIELACGGNMVLRTQMDYLAESGLEHAKGLILSPQDVGSEYWTGAVRQQLVEGSGDYYDVEVIRLGECNYQITCDAYRESNGEEIGRSGLKAELRLDPCIIFWVETDTAILQRISINGDVYCNGTLINEGVINGDVFANSLSGTIAGQQKAVGDLSLAWPRVIVGDFTSHYTVQPIGSSLSGVTFGPYDPVRVCYYSGGDVQLTGNVQINGMLVVEGDLTIRGDGNVIAAAKNLPALLVTGDLVIENGSGLDIDGLAVVEGQVQVSAGVVDINVVGGLFAKDGIAETAPDSSGNGNTGLLYNCPTWQPAGGQIDGAIEFDGIDDYVQTSDDLNKLQLTGDYTMAVWIKPDFTQKDWAAVFSKCDANGLVNHWTLQFDNVNPKKLIIHQPTASWDTGIKLGDIAGAWHHIRVVRSGEWMTSYLDSSEVHSNAWNANPGSGAGHLNIGVDRTALPGYVYKGLIDDIRIYDCAPDPNETYPSDNPVGHWELDEQGSGNITITVDPSKTAIVVWSETGIAENWGSAGGAFFRSIERK
ncbi:MAG: LamG domain-containing protein [Planctomycetota bacterium]|jgi:hypothetical protein